MVSKLNTQLLGSDSNPVLNKKQTLISLFNNITDIVCDQLSDIMQGQGGGEEETTGYITAKDFMNDFATEEFLMKNIRVRPVSGVTGKDVDEK